MDFRAHARTATVIIDRQLQAALRKTAPEALDTPSQPPGVPTASQDAVDEANRVQRTPSIMRCIALITTAAALSAPNIRVAEVPKLADRIEVTTTPSPIGHTEAIHFVPSGDIFVDDDALIASQVTATRSRMISEDATFFHRAGPRREVVFEKGEARACIVTCGGVCPGLNTVVRELYLCLAKQYGVQTVYGVQNGYSGFKNWSRDAVEMDSRFVYEIQRKGGTVLRSSRGGHDTGRICDALIENGVNMLFVIGGDGTMKGACLCGNQPVC